MKLSSKPISSPGRAEKFPPPLMRFLRSNTGSRSRGRSRTSPMFVRKKSAAIETQEPSSPKVTCMGQVRVRRSSKQAASKRPRRAGDGAKTRCRWIRKFLFCHGLAAKVKPKPCQPVWPKWGFCRVGSFRRKATKVREDSHSSQTESNFRDRCNSGSERDYEELEEEKYEEGAHVNADDDNAISFVSKSCTPPKNALLLTRCRSAPYRSSSLANRFWGSPLRSEETEQEQRPELENNRNPTESDGLNEQRESKDKESEEKLRICRELKDSVKERLLKFEESLQESRREGGDSLHPLVLTRCKSEPARTAQKIDAEVNFWNKRRSGFSDL